MERFLAASRKMGYGVGNFFMYLSAFKTALYELFPFMARTAPIAVPDFTRRGDHLFLPDALSAKKLLRFETVSFLVVLTVLVPLLVWAMLSTFSIGIGVFLISTVAFFYIILVLFKLWVVVACTQGYMAYFTPKEVAALSDGELPTYTILVPLREEAAVMPQIVKSLSQIDYPKEKLDLIITLEEYDIETRDAIKACGAPSHWRIVTLPDTQPKTKPKALNVAFLEAKGKYLVIYDAEIMPEKNQLKKAVLAFRENPDIACFQTRLDHYNTNQSLLTKLFTTEFTFYYDIFLPGLSTLGFPIPLSGHSTHFRMEALKKLGAWDPYNVAEDCDLGMRLYRMGFKSGMLDSFSREEATASLDPWIKQRTRWMKGFIQTSIVHLRHPRALKNELGGWVNFFAFLMLVPGMVFYSLLNIVSWGIFISWSITGADAIKSLYPMPVLYLSTAAFITGTLVFTFLNLVALYFRNKFHLVRYWFLTPFYWLLLSVAAARAVWQLIFKPHLWEKTEHGIHLAAPSHKS